MPRTISVEVEQVGPSTGSATARSHTVFVDRPVEKGGNDRGPLGGEYLLMSLGGEQRAGTVGGVPERFESMALRVSGKYSDEDLMRKLIALSERGCLVTNTLKDAVAISVTLEKSA